MKRRKLREKVKRVFTNPPKSSTINSIACHYKLWYVNYLRRGDCFFSKYFNCQKRGAKRQLLQKESYKYCSLISGCKLMKGIFCVSEKKLIMFGDIETNPGPVQDNNRQNMSTALSNLLLKFRLRQRGLRPQDVGGAGDCFFNEVHYVSTVPYNDSDSSQTQNSGLSLQEEEASNAKRRCNAYQAKRRKSASNEETQKKSSFMRNYRQKKKNTETSSGTASTDKQKRNSYMGDYR